MRVLHRHIPPHQWDEVCDYIQKSLQQGIIKPSSSPYASAVVHVRKRDGKLHLCVDYRAINLKILHNAYPLPRIGEALDALNGAKFYCNLYLAHGFHQVPVAEDDQKKTAFRVGSSGLEPVCPDAFWTLQRPSNFLVSDGFSLGSPKFPISSDLYG